MAIKKLLSQQREIFHFFVRRSQHKKNSIKKKFVIAIFKLNFFAVHNLTAFKYSTQVQKFTHQKFPTHYYFCLHSIIKLKIPTHNHKMK